MNTDFRARSETEYALRWVKRQMEWEQTLAALRNAGNASSTRPTRGEQEPAAA